MLTKQPNRKICAHCNLTLVKPNGYSKHGFIKWHKYCASCAKALYSKKFQYLLQKKRRCDKCNYTAEDKCQLDLIYKDGDKNNKDKTNLKTYCANCSRLYYKKLKQKKKSILNVTVDSDIVL